MKKSKQSKLQLPSFADDPNSQELEDEGNDLRLKKKEPKLRKKLSSNSPRKGLAVPPNSFRPQPAVAASASAAAQEKKATGQQKGNLNSPGEILLNTLKKATQKKRVPSSISNTLTKQYLKSANFWQKLHFSTAFTPIKSVVDSGSTPTLEDFPYPFKSEDIDTHFEDLLKIWDKLVDKSKAQGVELNGKLIVQAVKQKFLWEFWMSGMLGLGDCLLKLISCLSMGRIMRMISLKSADESEINDSEQYSFVDWIISISILFVSLILGPYCKTWFYHTSFELASKIRFTLIALIYSKIQEINVSVFSLELQPGRIINMCANDLNDLDYGLCWFFQLLLLPLNLLLSTLAIYQYLGIYSGVGVITLIIFIGLQEYYTTKVSEPLQQKNRQTDQRINLTKQFITQIKILKMYAWDSIFQTQIQGFRKQELTLTRKVMECIGIARSISNGSVLFSAFFMCVLFHFLSPDGNLSYEKIFSSLSILNVVKSSLSYFSSSRGWISNVSILSHRVAQILLSKKQIQSQVLAPIKGGELTIDQFDEQEDSTIFSSGESNLQQKDNQIKDKLLTTTPNDDQLTQQNATLKPLNNQTQFNESLSLTNMENQRNKKKEMQEEIVVQIEDYEEDEENEEVKKDQTSSSSEKDENSEQKASTNQNPNDADQTFGVIPSLQIIKQDPQSQKEQKFEDLYSIKERINHKTENSESEDSGANEDSSSSDSSSQGKQKKEAGFGIEMKDFSAYWEADEASLKGVDIKLTNKMKFVQIIGKSGSGKSTLLLSILREIGQSKGDLAVTGKISYVPQEAVIFAGTIKQNILFGSEYDYIRYSQVKALCNLHADLEKLPKKDDTILLEAGSNLSGGQRMRINLARALYSRSEILLLDDPLAALDAKVSENIFKQMFKTHFLDGRLVLMSSHQLQYSQEADYILILEDGSITQQGTYKQLESVIKEIQYNEQKESAKNELIMQKYKQFEQELQDNIYTTSGTSFETNLSQIKRDSYDSSDYEVSNHQAAHLEMMNDFKVLDGYKTYIANMGGNGKVVFLLFQYVATELSYIFFTNAFGDFSTSQTNPAIVKCGVYAAVFMILDIMKTIYFCSLNHFASEKLHSTMLDSVSKAPLAFFADTTTGNIINRFSSDIGVVDKTLPACLLELVKGLMSNLILILTVCFFNVPLIPLALIILAGLIYARKQFQQVISFSKQADLSSRSPIFNNLAETISNITVIRVFKQQSMFKQIFLRSIYDNSRAFYAMSKNQRMFDLYLELIILGMILIGISYILLSLFVFEVKGESVTLSIYFLINLGSGFSYAVRQTLTADINMLSTQRIHEYTVIDREEYPKSQATKKRQEALFADFPQTAKIEFKNVSLKYPNDIKLTLKKLNFSIESGQRIGVVGRTGAGKSSLVNALFRLYPIQKQAACQSSLTIDGHDIDDIPLEILRNNISIIPQVTNLFYLSFISFVGRKAGRSLINQSFLICLFLPFFNLFADLIITTNLIVWGNSNLNQEPVIFQGTARFNLDPPGTHSDEEMLRVLEEVGLANKIVNLEDDLQSLSVGEKQLICLARAFLKNSKILVLDEMTANLDKTLDEFIQEKVRKLFKDKTIIAIAHRLISIADYDKILVLDNGYLKDFDSPFLLLVENEADTRITKKKNIFAGLVKNTGKDTARKIMMKARDSYFLSKHNTDMISPLQ